MFSGLIQLNMNVHQIAEHPENFEKPDNNNDNDNNIQDGLDFVIHRNVSINKPEKNSGYD